MLLFKGLHTGYTVVNILIGLVVSFVVPFGVNFLVFGRSEEWQYFIGMMKGAVGKVTQTTGKKQ